VRLLMGHACVQHLADAHDVDVLHIKGYAIDPALAAPDRFGTDADVLVRASQADTLLSAMQGAGWVMKSTFRTGSPFEHAATLLHPLWGYADVHRTFPGITADPEQAFDRLVQGAVTRPMAGVPCLLPAIPAQVFILVLNATRSGWGSSDLASAWEPAPPAVVTAVRALVHDLGAEVAFAAATGDLDRFRGRREYDLWRVTTSGGGRIEEWAARIKAAPDIRSAARLAVQALRVNRDHLAMRLGREPTRREVVAEGISRVSRGAREVRSRRSMRRAR
jgi:hypothetical protein